MESVLVLSFLLFLLSSIIDSLVSCFDESSPKDDDCIGFSRASYFMSLPESGY